MTEERMGAGCWLPNPFSPGKPLDANWIVGRSRETAILNKAVRDHWPRVIISGARGMGKSTFARTLASHDGVRTLEIDIRDYVDARDVSQPDAAARSVIGALLTELPARFEIPASLRTSTPTEQDLALALDYISTADKPQPVIILDEMDFVDVPAQRALVRLSTRRHGVRRSPLWVFVIGQKWGSVDWPGWTSDHIPEIKLGLLVRTDISALAAKFLTECLLTFTEDSSDHIHSETGGHPLFVGALLDAIYDTRWALDDRSPVERDDVRSAVTKLEARPSDRIVHALGQAGPAVHRIMRTLAEDGREALSTLELRDIFASEWPDWVHELEPTLAALREAKLLSNDNGIWSHRIPILRGYVRGIDRAQVAAGDKPPRPDSWDAFRKAQTLEGSDGPAAACSLYQLAADLDPDFWLARWNLARVLIEGADRGTLGVDEHEVLRQSRMHLVDIERKVTAGTTAHRAIVATLCSVLCRLARLLPRHDAGRRQLLAELKLLDDHLETPGAAELIAETVTAEWTQRLTGDPRFWPDATRRVLRSEPYVGMERLWGQAAAWVTDRLDSRAEDTSGPIPQVDLVRFVVPVLFDERTSDGNAEHLAEAARSWLHENAHVWEAPAQVACLYASAWDSFLRTPPHGMAVLFLQELQPWLKHDLRYFLSAGKTGSAEQVFRLILDPQFAAAVGENNARVTARNAWSIIEEAVLSCETADARLSILEPLGRVLSLWRTARPREDDDIAALISTYVSLWMPGERVPASISSVETWEALMLGTPASTFLGHLRVESRVELSGRIDESEKRQVEDWLGGIYALVRRVPVLLPGYPAETVNEVLRAYLATMGDGELAQHVMVRTFQLRSPIGHVASLMRAMWERERRALATLSLTQSGRALLRYRDARWLDTDNVAILVTDWPGTRTLRDVLRKHQGTTIRAAKGHAVFWSQFMPVLEAINALHRAGFLHRSIAPEAIYERDSETDPDEGEADDWRYDPAQLGSALRLCHFEWSVYLRGLGALGPYAGRTLNRYRAPEALRAALGKLDRYSGETFSSDLYSLGLTLFESLIRPLRPDDELDNYKSEASYDDRAQAEHRQWLHGLRVEIREARHNGKIETFEEVLLLQLLEFDVGQRLATLNAVLKAVREANLVDRMDVREALPVFTVVKSQQSDPRQDVQNIAFYLRRESPDIDLHTDLSPAALSELIERDLRGATVFLNRHAEYPLLLRSRSGILYRLKRFEWDGEPRPTLAFLEVARQFDGDEPTGEPIGVLHGGVQVLDIGMGERSISRYIDAFDSSGWSELFKTAVASSAFIEQDVKSQSSRETLLDVLSISTEVEYSLGWKEAPYIRLKPGSTLVRAAASDENLAVTVSAWLDRDLHIEVGRQREAAGTGVEVGLSVDALDMEAGVVDLGGGISPEDLPETGILRPSGNRGISALYRRRKDVLRQIRDDSMLLEAAATPHQNVTELPRKVVGNVQFVLPRLDAEKQNIVSSYRRIRPLLVVQGPPGTGKTTLATEVILQTLSDIENARILVTAQGHAPLDNLLLRLLGERDRNPKAAKALHWAEIVRLKSGNRADVEYPERVRTYLPYERADVLFRTLRHESQKRVNAMGLDGIVAKAIAEALAPYTSAPTSLLRRVEDGANLVFVTTNAREVEEAPPASFDLVIVEEAARCVPIELLGVMRLARHWLLIGDHRQLPPFGYEMVMTEVRRRLEGLIDDATMRGMFTQQSSMNQRREQRRTSEATRLHELWRMAPLYMNLFRHFHDNADVRAAATLRTQWRMHPTIGGMVSDVFYDGDAVVNPIGDDLEALAKRTTHPFREPAFVRNQQMIWVDFDSADRDLACRERRSAGGQLENEAERRTLVAFLRLLRSGRETGDIVILTPYRKQMEQLRGLLNEKENRFDAFGAIHDRVFTVDSFQGQQAGTVVLSLVRNNTAEHPQSAVGFLAERQRATVMFSRAERLLIIFGSSAHFRRFHETSWVGEIHRRSHHINWTELLPVSERVKLDQRRPR